MTVKGVLICFLITTYCFITNLSAQNPGLANENAKFCNGLLSFSITTSPIYSNVNVGNKDFISSLNGCFVSINYGEKLGPGLRFGILFDPKRYLAQYFLGQYNTTTLIFNSRDINFYYNSLYIPFHITYRINKVIFSFGFTNRIPVRISNKDENNLSKLFENSNGFQFSFGRKFSVNKQKMFFEIEPYLLLIGNKNYCSHFSSFNTNEPSGMFLGVYLKLNQNILRF